MFWFNKDARLSIASVSIPFGQRFITIELEQQNKLVFAAPSDLQLQLTTEVFANSTGTSAGDTITSYRCFSTQEPVLVPSSVINSAQRINTIELYINNIFVNPEIHDIYIKRIGFSLIRVYRFQKTNLNTSSDRILLSQLKWPVETIYAGMRPKFNIKSPVYSGLTVTSGNKNEWRDWHRLTRLVDNCCYTTAKTQTLLATGAADPDSLTPANDFVFPSGEYATCQTQSKKLTYPTHIETLKTVKIEAHGINIYQEIDRQFYSDYQPYIYGGYNIVTPEDEGAVMINFCLYPGTYQPSGHINISRAREFYFEYTSDFIGNPDNNDPSTPQAAEAELLVLAIALNFLLISDGSAVLRYST